MYKDCCIGIGSSENAFPWNCCGFFPLLTVYVVPGFAGTDKVLTFDHNIAQSFLITVTSEIVLRITVAGSVKGKILQQTQLVSADISLFCAPSSKIC